MQSQKKWFRTAAILLITALLSLGLLTGCGGSSSGGNESSSNSSSTKPNPNPIPTPTPDPTPDSTPEQDPIPNGTVILSDQTGVYWKIQPTSKTTGTLVGYDSSKSALPRNLTFPSKLGDYTITSIDNIDFGNAKIVELTVPASVTQIANWAFSGMSGLQKVTIQGPAQLGSYLFYCCNDLVEVKLNDATTEIPDYAFALCKNLHNFKFPSQLKTIGNYAFYDADWAFYVEHTYDESTGWDNSYQKTKLPDGLTKIGEAAFESCYIDFIEIPAGVKKIGKNAFWETGLRYVEVLDGVEELDEGAFYNCELKDVYLPHSITSIGAKAFWRSVSWNFRIHYAGSETDWQKISITADNDDLREAELRCNAELERFEQLPSGQQASEVLWRYRPNYAGTGMALVGYDEKGAVPSGDVEFPAYINTTNGRMPVTEIGSITGSMSNFEQCMGITSIVIPDTVITIGQSAFNNCKWLTTIYLSKNLKEIEGQAFDNCTGLRSIALPESLTTIGYEAFYKTRISEVTVPASVTKLDWSAFSWNDDLLTATIKGAPQLGSGMFQYCTNLKSVKLNDAITEIPDAMFSGCDALEKINLPSQLKRIGKSAFQGTKIKELKLPDTVTQIGEGAFSFSGLEKIALSKSMKSIPVKAFSYSGLKQIYIPASVSFVDREAFNVCGITDIYYGGSDWSNVEINATGNDVLTDGTVTVHCNASSSDLGLMETTSLLSLFGF